MAYRGGREQHEGDLTRHDPRHKVIQGNEVYLHGKVSPKSTSSTSVAARAAPQCRLRPPRPSAERTHRICSNNTNINETYSRSWKAGQLVVKSRPSRCREGKKENTDCRPRSRSYVRVRKRLSAMPIGTRVCQNWLSPIDACSELGARTSSCRQALRLESSLYVQSV